MDVCVCGVLYGVAALGCHKTSTLLVKIENPYFTEPLASFGVSILVSDGRRLLSNESPIKQGVSCHRPRPV